MLCMDADSHGPVCDNRCKKHQAIALLYRTKMLVCNGIMVLAVYYIHVQCYMVSNVYYACQRRCYVAGDELPVCDNDVICGCC